MPKKESKQRPQPKPAGSQGSASGQQGGESRQPESYKQDPLQKGDRERIL